MRILHIINNARLFKTFAQSVLQSRFRAGEAYFKNFHKTNPLNFIIRTSEASKWLKFPSADAGAGNLSLFSV